VPSGAASAGAAAALTRDLDAIFGDPSVAHAQWSVAVRSLRAGDTLYTHDAMHLLVPASNQKLLTTAVAAERLGWDHRFTTRLYATGPVSLDGTLTGDLIVVGDGDPTINPRHGARAAVFDEWAAQFAARGIRVVSGRLIGDDDGFAEPGWGLGWSWDDFVHGFGSPIGALQFNENEATLSVTPAHEVGARALATIAPSGTDLVIDSTVTTAAAGAESRVDMERLPGTNRLRVRGQVALEGKPVTDAVGVLNPTQFYVNALGEALARHGILVAGNAVDVDDLPSRPSLEGATLLLEDRSPPLAEVIDPLLKWSRNGYAETLLWAFSPAGAPATDAAGLAAFRETLSGWGITPEMYLARDGSGLSRYDWVSADAVIHVLAHVWADPKLIGPYKSALPQAGASGSLVERMKGTEADGRVWAKTGAMSQVRSLSGYVDTANGEPLAFAIIVNGFRVPARDIDALMDRALVRLAGLRR